ncbi:hypothetical protein M422DRAFT_262566 [Sphaerobolus stellatus SS14]|uniref:Uncharacterized protein n=1 Tax=Sphaerobolus stellatus (strain SS14) TaxID=990650 RepID=A0A0C9VCD1_SPHS4|nr:hypothetical protein M422DRAFT_262566 [Sphaerobolus stellatus SS14]
MKGKLPEKSITVSRQAARTAPSKPDMMTDLNLHDQVEINLEISPYDDIIFSQAVLEFEADIQQVEVECRIEQSFSPGIQEADGGMMKPKALEKSEELSEGQSSNLLLPWEEPENARFVQVYIESQLTSSPTKPAAPSRVQKWVHALGKIDGKIPTKKSINLSAPLNYI